MIFNLIEKGMDTKEGKARERWRTEWCREIIPERKEEHWPM